MGNAIIGLGITWVVCYAIVSIIFVVISLFACGYRDSKISGVFKVMTGLSLAGIGIIAIIACILTTAVVGVNLMMVAGIVLFGGVEQLGQIGQQFIQENIMTFGIDVIAIISIIVVVKMLLHLTMTKEERQSMYKEIKEHFWG